MAQVIARGPAPGRNNPFNALAGTSEGVAKVITALRERETANAFAQALHDQLQKQQLSAQAAGLPSGTGEAPTVPTDVMGAAGGPTPVEGTGPSTLPTRKASPVRDTLAGMDVNQLARFIRSNPSLLKDPKKLNDLLTSEGDFDFKEVGGTLVRTDKRSGAATPVFTSKAEDFDFKVVNNTLFKTSKRGTVEKVASVDEPVKPQDALAKLQSDFKNGFVSQADFEARKRTLTELAPKLMGGPGGSIIDERTKEVVVPGRLNVVDPATGKETTVPFSSRAELDALNQQFNAGSAVQTSVAGRQTGSEIGANTKARVTATQQVKARDVLSKETAGLIQFSNTLEKVKTQPAGAFGLRGNVSQAVGGLVGQVSPELGGAITSTLSGGASEADITTLKTNARALVQAAIPAATGEETGRVSETERLLTEQVIGVFSNLTDKTQAQAALKSLIGLKLAGIERLRIEAGIPSEFDLDNKNDIMRFGNRLVSEFGLSVDEAKDALRNVRAVRREIEPLFRSK